MERQGYMKDFHAHQSPPESESDEPIGAGEEMNPEQYAAREEEESSSSVVEITPPPQANRTVPMAPFRPSRGQKAVKSLFQPRVQYQLSKKETNGIPDVVRYMRAFNYTPEESVAHLRATASGLYATEVKPLLIMKKRKQEEENE